MLAILLEYRVKSCPPKELTVMGGDQKAKQENRNGVFRLESGLQCRKLWSGQWALGTSVHLKKKKWPKKLSDADRDKEKIEDQILKWQDIEFN